MRRVLITMMLLIGLTTACYAADLNLAWDASVNATGYKLQISTDMGATWGEIRDAGTALTYTWVGAPDTGMVLIRVGAYNAIGEAWNTTKGVFFNALWDTPAPAVGLGVQ